MNCFIRSPNFHLHELGIMIEVFLTVTLLIPRLRWLQVIYATFDDKISGNLIHDNDFLSIL